MKGERIDPGASKGGPIVIVGRPHSGSRALAELCLANGIFLGADLTAGFLDSLSWYQRFVVPLMTSRYFPHWDDHGSEDGLRILCAERLRDTWPRYWNSVTPAGAWGWKFCETLFVIPIVKRLFPAARFIHIIRDGRDVCLSDGGFFQLTGTHRDPPGWDPPAIDGKRAAFYDFCLAVTFGESGVLEWRGLDLQDRQTLVDNRFLIQAQSWVTCVTRARTYGRNLGRDYLEIRYEDFCQAPAVEARRLFGWLGLPASAEAMKSLERVKTSRMRKWRRTRMTRRETWDFENAVGLASRLLQELGYEC